MSLIIKDGHRTPRDGHYNDNDDDHDTTDGDCLALRKVLSSGSPGKTVWIAFEEAAKHHRQKQLKRKESLATMAPSNKKPGYAWLFICGSVLICGAVITLIWTPFEMILDERLRMTRGLPPYDWWADPPDTVHFYAYIFNVTNHEEFMSGVDPKLKIQEIGPYVFKEELEHTDIHFNPNGTLTYTSIRKPIFLTELNHLPLNDTIIVPNIPYLAMASQLSNSPFFMRVGFNMLVNRAGTLPFVQKTVHDYFWNFTDPLIDLALDLVPSMVPTNNTGIIHTVYQNPKDVVTVFVGTDYGDFNFFKIDKWNGRNGFGHWENETCDSVQGSTEGVCYHQKIKRTDPVFYLRKTICRAIPLYYTGDTTVHGMEAFRYELLNTTWSRPPEPTDECYRDKRYSLLPSGLSDISPCYFGMPLASSFPHFYNGDPVLSEKLDGLQPDWEKHGSVAIIEPNLGLPFTEWARSQCNIVMRKMTSFSKLKHLTDMALPLFWLEYRVLGLPDRIINLLFLLLKVIKPYQTYMSVMTLFVGALCWTIAFQRLRMSSSSSPAKLGYNSVKAIFAPSEMTV